MSEENVEAAREIYRAWERGDFSSVEWADADIEFMLGSGADEAVHHGTEAIGQAWAEWLREWEEFRVEAEEFLDLGDDVLVLVKFGGRGKTSGTPVEGLLGGNLLSFRNGKVVRLATFTDRSDALEAAGLSEWAMSEQNVEIVRSLWEAVARSQGVDETVLRIFTEDCVMEDFPELPNRGLYHGREGVSEIERHFREMWGDFVMEPVEFMDAGDDLVIGVIAMRGRGAGSGAPLDAQAFRVHELRDGKLARMRAFTTKAQALEAAGLGG
jgi:ketosteroid isomerase-like protein